MKSLRILTENNKAGPKNYFHFFTFKSYLKEKKTFCTEYLYSQGGLPRHQLFTPAFPE